MLRIYPVILSFVEEVAPFIGRIARCDPDLARQFAYSARPERSFRRHSNGDSGVPEHGSERSDGELVTQCLTGVSPFFFRMEGPRSSTT